MEAIVHCERVYKCESRRMLWPLPARNRWKCKVSASGWITSQMGWKQTNGNGSPWVMGAKDHVSSIGHESNWSVLRTRVGRNGWLFDGVWFLERSLLIRLMCSSLHPVGQRLPKWLRLLEPVGPWSSVLKRAREKSAWITTRFDPGKDGTAISLYVCLLTPFLWSCERRVRCSCHSKMRKKNNGNPPCHTPPPRH